MQSNKPINAIKITINQLVQTKKTVNQSMQLNKPINQSMNQTNQSSMQSTNHSLNAIKAIPPHPTAKARQLEAIHEEGEKIEEK